MLLSMDVYKQSREVLGFRAESEERDCGVWLGMRDEDILGSSCLCGEKGE